MTSYSLLYTSKKPLILSNGMRIVRQYPTVEARFEQYPVHYPPYHSQQESILRTVFTIELKCDISSMDEERRKAFIDLTMGTAKQMYGQAAMMAAKSPTITVSEVGAQGKVNHPLFQEGEEVTPRE